MLAIAAKLDLSENVFLNGVWGSFKCAASFSLTIPTFLIMQC